MRLDERTRPWWTLVGSCLGLFVLMLDSTVVALALPSIHHDLDASRATLQWILNGYLLAMAALVVTAGRLGDIYGRRRVFSLGLATFAIGSVLAGAAPSALGVVAGRFVQGAGAAAMLPLSLALVTAAFPPAARARAVGIWAGISSIALAVGTLAGGAFVDIDWRLIFWINLLVQPPVLPSGAGDHPGGGRGVSRRGAGAAARHTGPSAARRRPCWRRPA